MKTPIIQEVLMVIAILLLGIAVLYLGSILDPEENDNTNNTMEEVLFDPSSLPPLRRF